MCIFTCQTVQEAQCLANEVELYYASPTESRMRLLRAFTESPADFKHMDLVNEMESVSLAGATGSGAGKGKEQAVASTKDA